MFASLVKKKVSAVFNYQEGDWMDNSMYHAAKSVLDLQGSHFESYFIPYILANYFRVL